jgi:putative pyruvate formate lyase activating enzyme
MPHTAALSLYRACTLCPRRCGVDRTAGETGYCGLGAALKISAAVIHHGEEPPVSGSGGSGAFFMTGCNVRCSFCQNYQISWEGRGRELTHESFVRLACAFEAAGAENLNIVTGTPQIPALIAGLRLARAAGVRLPVFWNSSGYESEEALALLRESVDFYLPDLKTLDAGLAERFFGAPDYPERAKAAILTMLRDKPGKVIIRHLVIPGCLESTRAALAWFARNAAGRAALSLMTQYTPVDVSGRGISPARTLNAEEYETLTAWLEEFDIEEGYYQPLESGESLLPDFRRPNPFPPALAAPLAEWAALP